MTVSKHLEHHLGPIKRGWSSASGPEDIQVCCFPGQPDASASTYATLGLSHHVLKMKDAREVRQELVMSFHTEHAPEALPSLLFHVAERMIREHAALLRGEVISLGHPVVPGTEMTALYASLPVLLPDDFATFSGTSPTTVFVWLFPILPAEARYIADHGWSAFEDALEQRSPDLLDPHRRSVI
jgi:hypothetical protein